jgi:hypothetical protein
MKGTEKQIKWAEDIKAQAIRNCRAAIAKNVETGLDMEENRYFEVMIEAIEVTFEKVDDAAAIINRRYAFDIEAIYSHVQKAMRLVASGKMTFEEFARKNGVNR